MAATNNGDWIRTMIGAFSAIGIATGGMYTVVIVPLGTRMDKLESAREDDRKQLVARFDKIEASRLDDSKTLVSLYLSLRENDQYKIFAQSERAALRRDLDKTEAMVLRIEDEQKRRTSPVASIAGLDKRIDNLTRRHEEAERRDTPTITDSVKELRAELQDLRRRIMVPISANGKEK